MSSESRMGVGWSSEAANDVLKQTLQHVYYILGFVIVKETQNPVALRSSFSLPRDIDPLWNISWRHCFASYGGVGRRLAMIVGDGTVFLRAVGGAAAADGRDDEEGRPRRLLARQQLHRVPGGQVSRPAGADGERRRHQGDKPMCVCALSLLCVWLLKNI